MGRVAGVKEKLHIPIYDAFRLANGNPLKEEMKLRGDERTMRFFVDVQGKTKLETNLQASGVLPSMNTFEARAMRVALSPPRWVTGGKTPLTPASLEYPIINEWQTRDFNAPQVLEELIYGSVTTLFVGEKIMIEMPTFYFPSGAGVSGMDEAITNHGSPDPLATFRFAEPVVIEPNQSFRVEVTFPHGMGELGVDSNLPGVLGPFWIWVVLDGYYTRDVQ